LPALGFFSLRKRSLLDPPSLAVFLFVRRPFLKPIFPLLFREMCFAPSVRHPSLSEAAPPPLQHRASSFSLNCVSGQVEQPETDSFLHLILPSVRIAPLGIPFSTCFSSRGSLTPLFSSPPEFNRSDPQPPLDCGCKRPLPFQRPFFFFLLPQKILLATACLLRPRVPFAGTRGLASFFPFSV